MTTLVLSAWAVLAVLFTLLWARQRVTRNATSVDVAWAASLGSLVVLYGVVGEGDGMRRLLVTTLGAGWAFRLAWFLARTRVFGRPAEDGRYQAMREYWGPRANAWLFLFYQGQAALAVLFSLPMLAAMGGGPLGPASVAGLAVWIIAVVGESVADGQLARFRADPANRGQVCDRGLWRYSRHPNYFFEWLHWWSYVLIGGGAGPTWIGPILMLLFLFRLTGIPYTELQALKTRGDAYRAYQRTTSVFVPWPPRRG